MTDPPGVVEFCRRMHPLLVGSLTLHCGDRELAAELAQETLARVWERWRTVSTMASPEAWTYRVAMNLSVSWYRRRAAQHRAEARLRGVRPPSDPEPATRLAVREAVASLPPRQRGALVLRYYADLSVDQAAEVLGCAPGTVKSLTSKAMDSLRQRLGTDALEEVTDRA